MFCKLGTIYIKMNSPYIYLIENILNGHKYVGKSNGKRKNYFGSGVAIKNAIEKYGKENFIKSILEECSLEELNDKEKEWISKLNTYKGDGYNLTPGGDGWMSGITHSEATLKAMRDNPSQRGRKRSIETIEKIKKSLKKYRDSLTEEQRKDIYGKSGAKLKGRNKTFSEEHKRNLSLGQKGKCKAPRSQEHLEKIAAKKRKKVFMLSKEGDEIIRTFDSAKQAAEITKTGNTCISAVCNGKQKTAGGYRWKFDE